MKGALNEAGITRAMLLAYLDATGWSFADNHKDCDEYNHWGAGSKTRVFVAHADGALSADDVAWTAAQVALVEGRTPDAVVADIVAGRLPR